MRSTKSGDAKVFIDAVVKSGKFKSQIKLKGNFSDILEAMVAAIAYSVIEASDSTMSEPVDAGVAIGHALFEIQTKLPRVVFSLLTDRHVNDPAFLQKVAAGLLAFSKQNAVKMDDTIQNGIILAQAEAGKIIH